MFHGYFQSSVTTFGIVSELKFSDINNRSDLSNLIPFWNIFFVSSIPDYWTWLWENSGSSVFIQIQSSVNYRNMWVIQSVACVVCCPLTRLYILFTWDKEFCNWHQDMQNASLHEKKNTETLHLKWIPELTILWCITRYSQCMLWQKILLWLFITLWELYKIKLKHLW